MVTLTQLARTTAHFLIILIISVSFTACSDNSEDADQASSGNTTQVASAGQTEQSDQPPQPPAPASPRKPDNTRISVLDISERNRDGKNGIAITFSTAIDTSRNIQSYFRISTPESGQLEGSWIVGDDTRQAWFMNVEPRTDYSITVNPGLVAVNGSTLMAGASENLTTRPLQPSVNFDSDGAILPLGYASGLPVVTVNVDEVDVDFFRIREEHLAAFVDYAGRYGRQGWYARTLKEHGDLVYSARFELNPPHNTRSKRDLDLQQIDELKTPGLYLAVMRAAGEYDQKEITWFSITDIGLHTRQYKDQLDVHAASLATGKPLAGIDLQIMDGKGNVLKSNRTTDNGLASFTGGIGSGQVLVAKTRNQYTLLNLQQPALDLSEFDLGSRPQLPAEFFIYAPRDLYRPGEAALFSGLLRNHDGHFESAPVLTAEIRNPSGTAVKSFKWQAGELGYYRYSWQIPASAPTGNWTLVVTGVLAKPVSYEFHVEEFLPERMKLTLGSGNTRTEITSASAQVSVPVLGEYLYGAPAAGNKFGSAVQISHWREPVDSLKGYQFGHVNDTGFTEYQELDDIFLDGEGKASLTLPNLWQQVTSPLEVKVIGSLYESGGRPVTRAHSVLIWPQQELIGIRPQFGDSNPKSGTSAAFDIVSSDIQGKLYAAGNVEVTLIKEDRNYFWEFRPGSGWQWNYSAKEFPVTSETLALDGEKAATVSFPVDWGRYRLEVKNIDNGSLSSVRFFAGYDWYYDWKNADKSAATRPQQVNLALDKPAYTPGDTAELKILPPADGQVLVLVESDRPLWSQKLAVTKAGATVKIPVDASWDRHDLYVSALLLQPAGKQLKTTPKRALGLIHLPLDREARRLQLSLDAPENTVPQSTLTTRLTIAGGQIPQQALVTLAAVDVGVLNISDFKTPDPFDFFFGKRRYSVDARDIYADVIEAHQADKALQRFGGDADLSRGGKKPQSEVQIVSLFQQPVRFDRDGKAEISMALPDFNGRLRLMALAFSDDAYGSQEQEVTIAAPIVAEIAMPRFLAANDSATLALDIQNMTESSQTLKVQVDTDLPLRMGAADFTLSLNSKAKTTLQLPVEAVGYDGTATIRAQISGDGIDDFSRSWKLGVRPAYPALTEKIQQVLKPGERFSLSSESLVGALPETLQATLEVSPFVSMNINEQMKYLLRYPYGCLEQTSSRAWPLTFATPENQARFGLKPLEESERKKMIQTGIDRILSFQRGNGSFGLWSKDSPEEHWLTVYATDFLLNAKAMGMDVPETQLENAIKRLSYYIRGNNSLVRQRWSQEPKHYAFATRAYAAYVLSTLKRAPLGTLRSLYQSSFKDAQSGFSQLQLGIALVTMGDRTSGEKAIGEALVNFPEEYRYWGDYGSRIRDLGMSIHLLLKHQLHTAEALGLSVSLSDQLRSRRWLSTQERIALFMAGVALEENFDQQWTASWQAGNQPVETLDRQQAWKTFIDAQPLADGVQLTSTSDHPLYVSAMVNGYGESAPQPVASGIEIERSWYTVEGKPVAPAQAKTGELFLVHIMLHSDQRVPDALVVNLLPAGFELENQNLDHAIKMDKFKIEGTTLAELQKRTGIKYAEYRDDRFVAAVDHNSWNSSHVFFLVRAVTPGHYQVPPAIVEDMYRPEIRAVSRTLAPIDVVNP